MGALAQGYKQARPDAADNGWLTVLLPVQEDVTGNLRPAFLTLLAAVAAVLLIACSNVANLLLVRFTGRRREIALRMALGASRSGIVRLFVFESTLVSVIAGLVGTWSRALGGLARARSWSATICRCRPRWLCIGRCSFSPSGSRSSPVC